MESDARLKHIRVCHVKLVLGPFSVEKFAAEPFPLGVICMQTLFQSVVDRSHFGVNKMVMCILTKIGPKIKSISNALKLGFQAPGRAKARSQKTQSFYTKNNPSVLLYICMVRFPILIWFDQRSEF